MLVLEDDAEVRGIAAGVLGALGFREGFARVSLD
jgi:hypothetical protein